MSFKTAKLPAIAVNEVVNPVMSVVWLATVVESAEAAELVDARPDVNVAMFTFAVASPVVKVAISAVADESPVVSVEIFPFAVVSPELTVPIFEFEVARLEFNALMLAFAAVKLLDKVETLVFESASPAVNALIGVR